MNGYTDPPVDAHILNPRSFGLRGTYGAFPNGEARNYFYGWEYDVVLDKGAFLDHFDFIDNAFVRTGVFAFWFNGASDLRQTPA